MTLTIDLLDSGVFNLLKDMESLDLIRINPPAKDEKQAEPKLSLRFAGALHLSAETYAAF
jgi:hypothetical protein